MIVIEVIILICWQNGNGTKHILCILCIMCTVPSNIQNIITAIR